MKNETTGHTPVPWELVDCFHEYAIIAKGYFDRIATIECPKGIYPETAEVVAANAAFILEACNNYERAIDILKTAVMDGRLQSFEDRERFRNVVNNFFDKIESERSKAK